MSPNETPETNPEPSQALVTTTLDLTGLPLWQRQYLGALEAGLTERDAVTHASVSHDIINRAVGEGKAFGNARDKVLAAVAVMSQDELRSRALSYGSVVLDDAFKESRDQELLPRDRLGNRRLLTEAAGVTGGGRGVTVAVPIQINVFGAGGVAARIAQHDAGQEG